MLVIIKKLIQGNSLVVQPLGLGAFTAMSLTSIPGLGTEMQQATRHGQKKRDISKMIWASNYNG